MLLAPALARADRFPFVTKGPVIIGVTETEATVTWYTAHHQGRANIPNACATGEANGSIPTLSLSLPDGTRRAVQDSECSRFHKVHLSHLAPGTAYSFELDKPFPGGATAQGRFRTAPASSEGTVRFVVYGDDRDEPAGKPSTRAAHEALVKTIAQRESEAAFLLNCGDSRAQPPARLGARPRLG